MQEKRRKYAKTLAPGRGHVQREIDDLRREAVAQIREYPYPNTSWE